MHLAIDEYEGLTSDEKEKLLARGVKRWLDVGWLNSDYIVNVITQEDWESQEKRSATD